MMDSELGKGYCATPVSSTETGFFRLPFEVRRLIYKLLLAVRHPIYLFLNGNGTGVQTFAPEMPRRWLALLHVSRRFSAEAASVAYGANRFTLVDTTQQSELLQAFLNGIGLRNAGFLSRLSMSFPAVEPVEGRPGKAKLREDSILAFGLLEERCTGLTTLETMVYPAISSSLSKGDVNGSAFVNDALCQIDEYLCAIPSLNKFVTTVLDKSLDPSVVELMRNRGWAVYPP